jgi:O-antigen/teichoic acid export membrane protein
MPHGYLVTVIARVFQIVGLMATLRAATSRLSPAEFGTWDLILKATMFAALIIINPVGTYINRRLHSWYARGLIWKRLRWFVIYVVIGSIVSSGLAGICFPWMPIHKIVSTPVASALIGFSLLVTTLNAVLVPSLNLLDRKIWWAVSSVITIWSGVGFALFLTSEHPTAARWQTGMLLGMFTGSVVACWPFIQIMRRNVALTEPALGRGQFLVAAHFMLPVCLVVGLNWMQFQSYRFVLGSASSITFLGVFAAGYAVSAGVLGAFESTAHQVFFPTFYRLANDASNPKDQNNNWLAYASTMIPLTILTIMSIAATADVACLMLIAPTYRDAAWKFVLIGAVVEGARVIGNVYSMAAHAHMNVIILVIPQLVGAALALGTLALALPYFKEASTAVGIALTLSALVYLITLHRVTFNCHKLHVSREMLSPFLVILVAAVLILLSCGIGSLFGKGLGIIIRSIATVITYGVCAWFLMRKVQYSKYNVSGSIEGASV